MLDHVCEVQGRRAGFAIVLREMQVVRHLGVVLGVPVISPNGSALCAEELVGVRDPGVIDAQAVEDLRYGDAVARVAVEVDPPSDAADLGSPWELLSVQVRDEPVALADVFQLLEPVPDVDVARRDTYRSLLAMSRRV